MQCVFFEKGIYNVQWGTGAKTPEAAWVSFGENLGYRLVGLRNLTFSEVTFNCKLYKNGGAGCITYSPSNLFRSPAVPPPHPVAAPMNMVFYCTKLTIAL